MEKEIKKYQPPLEIYSFTVIKPGGNDTALVYGSVENQSERKRINDAIMAIYPNIEQVGFIKLSKKKGGEATLQMAGGEFCGNASRSTAYLVLKGKPGKIKLEVSGVSRPIEAGVKNNGDAFAEMPIYSDPDKVTLERGSNRKDWLVEMEGITHLVRFIKATDLRDKSQEEIKNLAMTEIRKRDLENGPATGVIYVTKQLKGYSIAPVVYVRDIDTLFYETACGSGTTALGLVLAKQNRGDIIEIAVTQPSGMIIKVTVLYDKVKHQFAYAETNGPISRVLPKGMIKLYSKQAKS